MGREHTRFCYQPQGPCWFLTCTCWCHKRGDVTADMVCSQHHVPRSECDPDSRHVRTLRISDRLWAAAGDSAGASRSDVNTWVTQAIEEKLAREAG